MGILLVNVQCELSAKSETKRTENEYGLWSNYKSLSLHVKSIVGFFGNFY